MAELEVNLYLTMTEYGNNGWHSAELVKSALQESADFRGLTKDITIVDELHDVGGQDADCDNSPWKEWQSRVENNEIKNKGRSNLLITAYGHYDDPNGDGCAMLYGKAAMTEGGKAFDNVSSINDVPRFDTSDNKTHKYLNVAQMEVGHNYGGKHNGDNDHHGEDISNDGYNHWTPIVQGYGGLEGTLNVCSSDTLGSYDGDDRYYGWCMSEEIKDG